jgi:hypothetical protein
MPDSKERNDMAVAFIMDFNGTLDQYDDVIEKMELGGKTPSGGVFHWVAPTDDGFRVVDVWDSEEEFQKFSEEKIGPLTAEAGLEQPQVARYEVHNTLDQG